MGSLGTTSSDHPSTTRPLYGAITSGTQVMGLYGMSKRPKQVIDDDGAYLVFDRTCKTCQVQLTSRNRKQAALLCKACDAAAERARYLAKPTRKPRKSRASWLTKQDQARRADPSRKKAHVLLDAFLTFPLDSAGKAQLTSYLTTLEIAAYMRDL